MATKKDLVEAHSFSRRRLVTAFLSGAPGGREVEPSRPGRAIVGGLALAVLVVAGGAIVSVLSDRTPADWTNPGIVISKETGTSYVILDDGNTASAGDGAVDTTPDLRQIANITSAQLLFGASAQPVTVSQDEIDRFTPGSYIGIQGAPAQLPAADTFVQSGWTACTGDHLGLAVDVAQTPAVQSVPDQGAFLVRSAGDVYVIAEGAPDQLELPRAYAYLVPKGPYRERLIGALGFTEDSKSAQVVPGSWIDLFAPGGELGFDSFGITDVGRRVDYRGSNGVPPDARVGEYVALPEGGAVVLTADGPAPLTPWAAAVYVNSTLPGGKSPAPASTTDVPGGRPGTLSADAHWPADRIVAIAGQQCVVLETSRGGRPAAHLAQTPTGSASAADLREGDDVVRVATGTGAYVLSGDWNDEASQTHYVLDSLGDVYKLIGTTTLQKLDYAGVDPPVAPDSWIELFDAGVDLSSAQALCPPKFVANQTCQ